MTSTHSQSHGFIGCPGEAADHGRRIVDIYNRLPIPGSRAGIFHWATDFDSDAATAALATQSHMPRPSRDDVDPVFILLAHRIGTPLERVEGGWGALPDWLNMHGWGMIALCGETYDGVLYSELDKPPPDKVPLTGTLYEMFEALRAGRGTYVRIHDLRALVPNPDLTNPEAQRQAAWADIIHKRLADSRSIVRSETERAFDAQVERELRVAFRVPRFDPMNDPLPDLQAVSYDVPLLFAREKTVKRVSERALNGTDRCTRLTGLSGVGKSSLLRGGLAADWYAVSPRGRGHRGRITTIVFEPDALVRDPGADPLASLVRLMGGEALERCLPPLPEILPGIPPPPPVSGDADADLAAAAIWWRDEVAARAKANWPARDGAPAPGPLVLMVDQAEQIDARARRAAADRAAELHSEVEVGLDPAWRRFTDLMAFLSGALPDHVSPPFDPADCNTRVVLGLHRLSALDLWRFDPQRAGAVETVSPIVDAQDWRALIEGTFAAYGFDTRGSGPLIDTMVSEAAGLADIGHQGGRAGQGVASVSVLPQARMALFRVMDAWKARVAAKAIRADRTALALDDYRDETSIANAINALGNQAEDIARARLAEARRIDPLSLDGMDELDRAAPQAFGLLMRGLVLDVTQNDFGIEQLGGLAELPVDDPRARAASAWVEALRDRRLLSRVEGRVLRIPHRSILQHWSKVEDWQRSDEGRMAVKETVLASWKQGRATPDARATWSDDQVSAVIDLALNWVGPDAGRDRNLRDWLNSQLVMRVKLEDIGFDASSPLGSLVFAALFAGAERLAESLMARVARDGGPLPRIGPLVLGVAAEIGSVRLVTQLLDAGVDASATAAGFGVFPLLQAAQNGHAAVVEALLARGAEPNRANANNGTFPLLQAASNGHAAVVEALLSADSEPNRVNANNGAFPLLMAAQEGHTAVVEALLAADAEPNSVNANNGTFPLLMAAQECHAAVVEALLARGAEPNMVHANDGSFPLLMAAQDGHAPVVEALLAKGALPNLFNGKLGGTPLQMAAQSGHVAVVEALLAAGADPNQVDHVDGTFPLLIAAQNGHTAVVEALLSAGAEPNSVNANNGNFPLLMAAQNGHAAVVEALLARGAEPNSVNGNNGAFPLLIAAEAGHAAVVEALLAKGAEPNLVHTNTGLFPLLQAAQQGHAAVVEALLAKGAEIDKRAANGMRPYLLACGHHHADVMQCLEAAGAAPLRPEEKAAVERHWQAKDAQRWDALGRRNQGDVDPDAPSHLELPGARQAMRDPDQWQPLARTGFAALAQKALQPTNQLRARPVLVSAAPRLDLVTLALAFDSGDLAGNDLRALFIARRGDRGAVLVGPGLLLDAAARSLRAADHVDFRTEEVAKAWAAIALLCGAPTRHALPEDAPLPFDWDAERKRTGHVEDNWRPWRMSATPEGRVVELPWIVGDRLERGRVLVPVDGVGTRVLDNPTLILDGIEAFVMPFVTGADGAPTPLRRFVPVPDFKPKEASVTTSTRHCDLAAKLLGDAATLFQQIGESNPALSAQMAQNKEAFVQVAGLLVDPLRVVAEDQRVADLAAQLLRDAATFFRVLAKQSPEQASQMDESAALFEQVATLVAADPLGVIGGDQPPRSTPAPAAPTPHWHLPPTLPGDWTERTGADAADLLAMLGQQSMKVGALDLPLPAAVEADRVRTLDLPCYGDALLVEVRANHPGPGLVSFILHEGGLVLLDGTSPPIHALNEAGHLKLDTEARRHSYLQLFMNWVRGSDSRFQPLQDAAALRHRLLDPADEAKLAAYAGPITFGEPDKDGAWPVSLVIVYSGMVFHSELRLLPSGMIEMTKDGQKSEPFAMRPELMNGPILFLGDPPDQNG